MFISCLLQTNEERMPCNETLNLLKSMQKIYILKSLRDYKLAAGKTQS